MIDHHLCQQSAYGGTKAIGHHHKQALGRIADIHIGLLVHKERTADVEEVKGHSIYYHAQHKPDDTATGIAHGKEQITEHPGQHGHEHHTFDTELLQEEGNEQNAKGLAYLTERDEYVGMLHAKGILKLWDISE